MKRIITSVFIVIFIFYIIYPLTVSAKEPYDVYNYDKWGEAVPSQAGYTAEKAVSGEDLGTIHFNSPNDIFRSSEDIFFIADTGNNRIVAVNSDMDKIVEIYERFKMPDGTETLLSEPKSVYVSPERSLIYIADSGNSRILVSDMQSNIVMEITAPKSDLYKYNTFQPIKILADKAGNIYVVLNNITSGAALFFPDGEFAGYYGANRADHSDETFVTLIKSFFSTDAKKARSERRIPSGITSFDIDERFIYTCTQSSSQITDTIKKINSAGDNIIADKGIVFGDIVPLYDTETNTSYRTMMCDIDIGDDGTINCLDSSTGRVFQYDEECNLLFVMGTQADQLGGFSNQVTAVESMGEKIYVLDAKKNTTTVFRETSFGNLVHKASLLYNGGYYEEAYELWQEVLKRDGGYYRAYLGISAALLKKGEYGEAMKYARLAASSELYNKAFEGKRAEFLKEYFNLIVILTAVILLVLRKIIRTRKKRVKRNA